jgi:hypothetical protein
MEDSEMPDDVEESRGCLKKDNKRSRKRARNR